MWVRRRAGTRVWAKAEVALLPGQRGAAAGLANDLRHLRVGPNPKQGRSRPAWGFEAFVLP